MDPSASKPPPASVEAATVAVTLLSFAKAVDAYKTAVGTAATVTTYVVLARGMARELLPYDLRAAARWAASLIRARLEPAPVERRTLVIKRFSFSGGQLDGGGGLYDEDGDSMTDAFEGVVFTWASVAGQSSKSKHGNGYGSLELSFDAEHTDMALERYVPFITATVAKARRKDRALQIFMNEGSSWHGINHHHPATFDTLAMDPAIKQSVVADLDRFLGRRDYYRRIGKAWKRGYLLYGPPGTGKSSLIAAMANYLRFNLYDLDPSEPGITLSGLLNFIDGLWSTSGEERIIIFTTNYKDRLAPALLRPGRMDMHIYMGYCGWEAFRTLARNYFLVNDHARFPEIKELLSGVEPWR
ncbi:unnamed protein product [Miscanthus lutarioriparius]|uniref:ATPase AAA-type core domain-containing protein n=1 Tax=Miscanthus lutarioriparius TaxID=422564 RepID=A0A811NFD8_9POAL|nr:unnamed protein product [Miscanthus lutarioriparius]